MLLLCQIRNFYHHFLIQLHYAVLCTWRAIFSLSYTSYLLDFSDCSTVSHLKVKNKGGEIHAVDGVRGELCSYCSLHWISCARFQVKEGVQGERTLGNLCIIEVSPWDSSSVRNSSFLSLSPPHWLFLYLQHCAPSTCWLTALFCMLDKFASIDPIFKFFCIPWSVLCWYKWMNKLNTQILCGSFSKWKISVYNIMPLTCLHFFSNKINKSNQYIKSDILPYEGESM